MATIKISDLDLRQDSALLAECTPDEAAAIMGGLLAEIGAAIGGVIGSVVGGPAGAAAGAAIGGALGSYGDKKLKLTT